MITYPFLALPALTGARSDVAFAFAFDVVFGFESAVPVGFLLFFFFFLMARMGPSASLSSLSSSQLYQIIS